MRQEEFNAVFDGQVERCAETLKKKSAEYAGDGPDRLRAFKTAAALQHCRPGEALAGMLAKHVVSIYDMCRAEEDAYGTDVWDEKITDSINYLILLKAVIWEEAKDEPDRGQGA